jgi:hypothetical protein
VSETDFAVYRQRLARLEEAWRRLEDEREALIGDLAKKVVRWASEAVRGWEPRLGDPAMHVVLTRSEPRVEKVTATTPLRRGTLCFTVSEHVSVTFDPRLQPEDAEHPSCVLPPDVWARLEQLWRADPPATPDEAL